MASSHLLRPISATTLSRPSALPFRPPPPPSFPPPPHPRRLRLLSLITRAWGKAAQESKDTKGSNQSASAPPPVGEEEAEEDLPWIQEKALDLVEFTGTVTHAIPGPRVGQSPLPWLLALPLAYVGISFVVAFVKTVRKITSPKAKRKRLVNTNAFLLKSIDELFLKGKDEVTFSALKGLMQKVFNDAIKALRVSYKKMNPFCVPFATTNMGSAMLAMDLGWMGPNYSISTACATCNFCILNAANHIIRDEADVMLCGGSDAEIIPIGYTSYELDP